LVEDESLETAYRAREQELGDWHRKKTVSNPRVGMKIDVRDTEDIWCIGIIKQVIANESHSQTLLIHYQGISD
jgi:hypothetical protein